MESFNYKKGVIICTEHAILCKDACINSDRLKPLIEKGELYFPKSVDHYCFQFSVLVKTETIVVSCSIPSHRCGNRIEYNEISDTKRPSFVEFLIIISPSKLDDKLKYDGDIRSFNLTNTYPENGFKGVIDEILRIHDVMVKNL
jgi:hypothetical protein